MDTGKHENFDYYKGYEGEGEFIVSLNSDNGIRYHVWEGYIDDIFENPVFTEQGRQGLTKDYQEMQGAFADDCIYTSGEPESYLEDLEQYRDRAFAYPETKQVYSLLVELFETASKNNDSVIMELS